LSEHEHDQSDRSRKQPGRRGIVIVEAGEDALKGDACRLIAKRHGDDRGCE
jgi:hypothetical protein